jgi:hypothetical protein
MNIFMDYSYLIENNTIKNIDLNKIFAEDRINCISILCYHICNKTKYPFIQFLMQYLSIPEIDKNKKMYFKESLFLPNCYFDNPNQNIEYEIIKKIKNILKFINFNDNLIINEMYKGLFFCEKEQTIFALVNISNLDIFGLKYEKIENYPWFILPSEILNNKSSLNIEINNETIKLFENNPEIALLTNNKNKSYYNLPDVAYTFDEIKNVEFNTVFGNQRKKIYESCGEYFYFYRDYINMLINIENNIKYKKTYNIGINRYAVFIEGKIYFERNNNFSLNEKQINSNYPEDCIIICYNNKSYNMDLIVKRSDNSLCLSYQCLD